MVTDSNSQTTSVFARPWAQLIVGIICMVMIANLQYGWTLFVGPIGDKYHWGKAAIQVTFTIFVLLETWLVPAEGYLVDRFGPKWIVVIGGVLCGIAWTINSFADSLGMFYFAAALGGLGGDHHSHRPHDQELRLRAHLPDVRPDAGHRRRRGRLADHGSGGEFHGGAPEAGPRRQPLPGETARDAQDPGLLGDVCHVRDDGGRRFNGGCATCTDRQGFQGCRRPGEPHRTDDAGAHLRPQHRSHTERPDAAILRLGVGPDRA